jgi:hypothetical protein
MSKVWTLTELDEFIEKLKASQYKSDRMCSLGRDPEPCGFCRSQAGYWGDLKAEISWILMEEEDENVE